MSDKIQVTADGLAITNDAGKKVIIRTNHSATSDQYIDLPSSGGTISTAESATDTDEKTKISSNDTRADYLENKLVAGSNITLTTNNDGGNETITIASAGGVDTDEKSKVSANDTTAGYLNGKLVAGSGISFTENNNGSDETLTIASTVTDQLVKARSSDTTANYLASKLAEGTGISFNILNSGGNELISIASTVTNTDQLAKVSSNDTTAGYLNGKLVAGSGITLTEGSDGGNETLTIAASGGGGGAGGFTFYDVTLRDCENTSSSVKIIETTIPANTWEDGQALTLDIAYDISNQSGSSDMPLLDVRVDIFAVMSLMGSIPNGISTRQWIRTTFFRNGNNLYISGNTSFKDNGFAYPVDVSALTNPPTVLGTGAIAQTSVSFASNLTIALDFRFMNANPSLYVRPFYGTAYKTEKGSVL